MFNELDTYDVSLMHLDHRANQKNYHEFNGTRKRLQIPNSHRHYFQRLISYQFVQRLLSTEPNRLESQASAELCCTEELPS